MFKFIKYEMKNSYKFILMVLVVLLMATTLIQGLMADEFKDEENNLDFLYEPGIGLMLFILGIGVLLVFIHGVKSFYDDINANRSNLIFSLPMESIEIILGKNIFMMGAIMIIGLIILGYSLVSMNILFGKFSGGNMMILEEVWAGVNLVFYSLVPSKSFNIYNFFILWILILNGVYFSLALSKVRINNKSMGGKSFLVFLWSSIFNIALILYVIRNIDNIFLFKTGAFYSTAIILFQIGLLIIYILATAYILEKKVDL